MVRLSDRHSRRGRVKAYWYSDDRSVQFKLNRQKSGRNRAVYGHWSIPVFLINISKYRLDRQLVFVKSSKFFCNAEKHFKLFWDGL